MGKVISCILGPRLYRFYRPHLIGDLGGAASDSYYQPGALEKHTDSVLALASVLCSVTYYASPLLVVYLYSKDLLALSYLRPLSKCAATLGLVLAGVTCLRGLGRWMNPQYREFISTLQESRSSGTPESKRQLSLYSFDFRSWPPDFYCNSPGAGGGRGRLLSLLQTPPRPWGGCWALLRTFWNLLGYGLRGGAWVLTLLQTPPSPVGGCWALLREFWNLLYYIIRLLLAHTLGRRLLFPGSVQLLQRALLPALLQGQARLVEQFGGQRAKLVARDGNEIDAMVVDRRGRDPRGDTLVICCEGNAGFYEIGCMCTPLEAGYSVLGWNHPGFGGSTGVPLPQSEANAMDAVMQYALQQLRFPAPNIVVYAWSIGGYTATWAAMSYPDLGGLVLDASFDDLVPLALKVLPQRWESLVTRTVREHLNLENAKQLCRYNGPVLLVRRTRDEVITTTGPEDIASNRGNDLLLKLLQHRYPKILVGEGLRAVREWLEAATPEEQSAVLHRSPPDQSWCREQLEAFAGDRKPPFPWQLGEELSPAQRRQLALYLAQKHLQNFEASHCTPLPPQEFHIPWVL